MAWRRAFFRKPITFVVLFIRTFKDPRNMTTSQRDDLKDRIFRLSNQIGFKTQPSARLQLRAESLSEVPNSSGVYRIYREHDLQYIGKSFYLRERLAAHLKRSHNDELKELINSSNVFLEWYEVLFAGWIECYEHVQFKESNGHLPPLNKKMCGDTLD